MKIGIDIRTATDPKDGKGVYTWNLVRELLRLDRDNEYLLYTNHLSGPLAELTNSEIRFIPSGGLFWHFSVIKDFLKRSGELFFSPTSFIIPAFLPRRITSIITVHDLIAFLHPNLHETKATILEKLFLGRALRKAHGVLVPSENTKRDLMRIFKQPEKKISVTQLGRTEQAHLAEARRAKYAYALASEVSFSSIQKQFGLPEKFILTVANLSPRKNVGMLVDAFLSAHLDNTKLVIVGGLAWRSKKFVEKITAHRDRIIHIESASREELNALYRQAKIFAYPSLYEGFGLPPLEAMAAGCPVICSNAASLPEVCGDAAILCDPRDIESWRRALEQVLTGEKLRAELAEKGRVRAAEFSWSRTAEQTLKVIQSI